MNENLIKRIVAVCEVLNKHKVQYLIVGGTAVALHGYFRGSINIWGEPQDEPDLDFWYNPTYDNYFRLLNALSDLGLDVQEFKNEQAPNPKRSYFKFQLPDFTLDFLPQVKAPLNFRTSYQDRITANLNYITVDFISLDDLIKDKEATARAKDLTDIKQLRSQQRKS